MPARAFLPAGTFLLLVLLLLTRLAAAQSQQLDGTWILFDDPTDPELARLAAAGATVPRDQLEATRRITFSDATATVHAAGKIVTLTLDATPAEWGVDARVTAREGTAAPIDLLRIEFSEPGRATLTSFQGQTVLERFAMLRVRATL